MRRLGRLSSAALAGGAVLLVAGCGHAALTSVPATAQSTGQSSSPAGSAVNASGGPDSAQLSQIDNQLNQIDNQIGQANQGLATSEGDPAQ